MSIFEKSTPRWIIFLIDLSICFFSLFLAYLLRFNFSIPDVEIDALYVGAPFLLVVRASSFFVAKTYNSIIRYTSSKDAQRIFVVVLMGTICLCIANLINYYFVNQTYLIPYSIIIIDFLATTFLVISTRIFVKVLYFEFRNPGREKTSVIIYGAGESGLIAKRTLDRDAGTKYKVIAFIDDNLKKTGKKLEGVRIYSFSDLDELLEKNNIAHVILSIQKIEAEHKKEIIEKCLLYNTKVLNVPPANRWINGELSFKQIKKIKIEDLLERDSIQLDFEKIKSQLNDKRILVTGAAGSIGSEICRQIAKYNPQKIILLDQAESALHDLELNLIEAFDPGMIEVVVGDIRNKERVENVFRTFSPHLVYHAAAYKHVPMMENNPSESLLTNVLGTKIVSDLASQYEVEEFVMISTDKAVNPTNVMGASKRIAEIYIHALNKHSKTNFVTTRFGNVLGSNGSVILRFQQQIDKGGPITVTHPEMTRYFMTIPEACQLVLEAGAMGKGGEIFIFDMGKSVKIIDLARKMVKLSGLTLGKDIQMIYTGLRPGEKLYEELLNDKEKTVATHNSQIMIAKVNEYEYDAVSAKINELIKLFKTQDNFAIVKLMKELVPEFKSKNSIYEQLDKDAQSKRLSAG